MSVKTNPDLEPSVTCGFFNSISGDRKYTADTMSAIFDGIIVDGIFKSIGNNFVVTANSDGTITIGTGKCWFDHTWTLNDAPLILYHENEGGNESYLQNNTLIPAAPTLPEMHRIDAVVIETNNTQEVRDNCIKIIEGTASTTPSRPKLTRSKYVNQYPLAYITRPGGVNAITQDNITNMIGTTETPFITGILEHTDPDILMGQWDTILSNKINDYDASIEAEFAKSVEDIEGFKTEQEEAYSLWWNEMKTLMEDVANELDVWTTAQKTTILEWFNHLTDELSENSAVNLQLQIDIAEIKRTLMCGLLDGEKTFSEDGTVITSTDSSGQTLVKTFTNNFQTITTVFRNPLGVFMGQMVKHLSSDGKVISTEVIIPGRDDIVNEILSGIPNADVIEY